MKWSEQMRVLQSEDEHYNQLMYDTVQGELFINDELICVLDIMELGFQLPYDKFEKIIRKYPFFNDLKFLFNCIFFVEEGDSSYYYKPNNVNKHKRFYEICANVNDIALLRIYFKESEGPELE